MTERDLINLLAAKYCAPEYAFLPQVRDGTVAAAVRTADALAFSLWPSRGLVWHGFECKVSRSDWTRELKDPAKAHAIGRFCDYWWVVAAEKVVQPGELPPAWGLLVASAKGDKLRTVTAAPKREAEAFTRPMLAAVLRSVARAYDGAILPAEFRPKLRAEYDRGVKDGQELRSYFQDRQAKAMAIERFEAASGVKIGDDWLAGTVGEAVKLVLDSGTLKVRSHVENLLRASQAIARDAERALTAFKNGDGQ